MTDYEEKFNASYWRVISAVLDGVSFNEAFYKRFLRYPEIAQKFVGGSLEEPIKMLRLSITLVASFYFRRMPHKMLEDFARAHSHRGHNIDPRLYDFWLESVLETIKAYDPECDESVLESWRKILVPGIEFMKSKFLE